jgi:ABC-type multidrug transport system fused ATPase/permease subunit
MSKIPPLLAAGRFKLMLLLIFIGIMQAAATISSLLLAKTVFDRILKAQGVTANEQLLVFGAGLLLIAIVIGCLSLAERVVAEKIGQSYAEAVRITLYDRLTSLPQRALQNRSQGGVMLRFVGDLTAVRQWVSLGLARLTVIGLTTFGSLAALAFINWILAATVGIVLLLGAGISISRGQEMRAASRESRRRMSRLAANINEKVGAISVLQVFGQSARERKRMMRQSRQLHNAMVAKARVGGKIRGLAEGFSAFAYGSALVVGAMQVNLAQTSPGAVIAALTVISLLVPKLRDLGRVQEYWHGFSISCQKMTEFLNIPSQITELPDAANLQRGSGRLEFNHVSLSGSLQEITVTAEPSSIIAIVGSNGAGKTTLLALAARLIDPDSGEVLIDGQNISQYSLASLRKLVGVAGPDFPLLRGTLQRNLTYRCPRASEAERDRVKKLCGIDEVLASLPQGEETRIAEGGAGLSAGQRQRIALARALLGNPPILLLDEADANLDAQAASVIDQVLVDHTGTVLLISHRRERIAKADVVWFMDNGCLLEVGTPEQVLSGSGPTAKFFAPRLATANSSRQGFAVR